MYTLADIQSQLASLFNGGQYQGNGATTFAAPTSAVPNVAGNSASFAPAAAGVADVGSGFGANLGTLGAGIQGLSALSGLLQGNKALGLAKDQFKFQKSVTNTNLNNSIKSYNTALEDRLTARGVQQGDDPTLTQERIDRNRLTR